MCIRDREYDAAVSQYFEEQGLPSSKEMLKRFRMMSGQLSPASDHLEDIGSALGEEERAEGPYYLSLIHIFKMRMKMDMSMTMDGQTMNMSIDGDVGIADPGQPVDVPLPNIAEYVDIAALENGQ